ncbi:MAG: hypothetical protein Q8Q04_02065 [archaeon]|nr:hypothetical protein [archaeon]
MTELEKLSYDNGEPKLNLSQIKNTVINLTSKENYDTLMILYEASRWKWKGDKSLPTTHNYWSDDSEKTCIDAEVDFEGFMRGSRDYYEKIGKKVLYFQDYIEIQGISEILLEELTLWFEANKPERKSKGIKKL